MATVKTAISIEKSLFEEVEQLARKTKLSRSQVFSQAAEYFIHKDRNNALLNKLNEVYGQDVSAEEKAWYGRAKKYHAGKIAESWK